MDLKWKFDLTDEEFEKCSKFSKESAKSQRENRSGGILKRSVSQISEDTLRGKVAEVIVKKFLDQEPLNIFGMKLDFNIYSRGKWDDADIIINDKKISIKSAKWFSRWLLLETKDIDREDTYDFYLMVLVDRDMKSAIVKGFVTKEEILSGKDTIKLTQGDFIPETNTRLDASNYARKCDSLNNSSNDWIEFSKLLKL